jgi:Acetyltransferase (GNAT) domain
VSAPPAAAELIEDRGEAAMGEDFFRSPEFLGAEAVTHTLRIESGDSPLLVPVIVRGIPPAAHGDEGPPASARLDAISPYGYPGAAAPCGVSLDPTGVDFSATGLVSLFLRHTLAEPLPLLGTNERNVVQIADPALPPKSRPSDRSQISRNERRGYAVRLVPGPETTPADRAGFLAAYEQTMRRAGATERYFFGATYFDRILESPRTWLALAHDPEGEVAAASIAADSDGYLHYYLSGSADSHLRDSPMKNVVAALVELSTERGLPLNLGGGIARGDRLEEFKRGFANREQPWRTSEIVCDRDAYDRLSAGREGSFFPLYRAS